MSKPLPLSELQIAAELAAKKAGPLLVKFMGEPAKVQTKKSAIDLVTEIDRESETILRKSLNRAFPGLGFLGEEHGYTPSETDYRWIIDPIDGTMNFVHGIPFFCISIGLEYRGKLVVGVIYDPCRKEMFSAIKGGKTTLNGEPVRVSKAKTLDKSVLSTGFSSNFRTQSEPYLSWFVHFERTCHAVRRMGSTALYLAYVASGRMEGFYEQDLHPWDVAGGIVLVNQAGGRVSNLSDGPVDLQDGELVATNKHIHTELIRHLNENRK